MEGYLYIVLLNYLLVICISGTVVLCFVFSLVVFNVEGTIESLGNLERSIVFRFFFRLVSIRILGSRVWLLIML